MVAVSAPLLFLYMFVLSVVLAILNQRGTGTTGAIAATILVSAVPAMLLGFAAPIRTTVAMPLLFVVIPGAMMCAVSRLDIIRRHPWRMLLFGPLCFVVALVVAATTFNIVQSSR